MKCRKCFFPRDEPKGARICKRCGHQEGVTPSAQGATPEPVDTAAVKVVNLPAVQHLPEHSPLGASSAERWMNCSGSVALIHALKTGEQPDEEEPDYRRDGVEAHSLAAFCLEGNLDCWEAPLDRFPSLTPDMMEAVQVYLDFTRALPGRYRFIETRVHRPEFHPMFYGTLDFIAVSPGEDALDIADYKHGEGILVEVEDNPQLQYYAYGYIAEDRKEFPDEMRVRLHVCQPRGQHPAGPIRTWDTSAGAIRGWAREILRPAMDRTINDRFLSVGSWCRFCPAKLICPAMTALADEFTYRREAPLQQMPPELIGDLYEKAQVLKMLLKAVETETSRRVLGGDPVPGVKAVMKRTDRAFKEEAPLETAFGDDAWQPRKPVSPAQAEKLANGKEFVAEWAFTPEAGLTIALDSDKRAAVAVKSGAETFGAALQLEAAE